MSYIDSFKHELVGLFGRLPVYHPLEDIPADPEAQINGDFGCSTDQIVIGGGAGEHPAVVLLSAPAAVVEFVFASKYFELPKAVEKELCAYDVKAPFVFSGWGVEDYHGFYELCCDRALPNPYSEELDMSFEIWLHASLGEFIYYSMPQLAQEVVDLVQPLHVERPHVAFNNIGVVPPNMPTYANHGNAFFKT